VSCSLLHFFCFAKSFSSCSSRNELSQKIMVLELISRLEIDRSAVRESENDDEDGTDTTTNDTAPSNVLKINVKE